jgi:uncharacterized membrane protein
MFGLTSLGLVHTVTSLVAVAAGVIGLLRDRQLSWSNAIGKVYVAATVLTCVTGFGIFQHGGFGKPHVLGIVTPTVLGLAALAAATPTFGRASAYVATISYSLSFFFDMIPGATETFTRLPLGAPVFAGPDDPTLQKIVAALFVLFLIGAALQARRLHAHLRVMQVAP